MRLLVRTWNVFHGNAHPPRRAGFLRRMIELATADRPDVLCLQELPVWGLRRLEDWSGMQSLGAVARPPIRPGLVTAWITGLNQGLFRSGLAGQANAVLVDRRHGVDGLGQAQISAPGRERRVVQAVRLRPGGSRRSVVVGNLHASNVFHDPGVPRDEVERARAFVERQAAPGEPVVLAGDFNVTDPGLVGYSPPGQGIDDVLARGADVRDVVVWPVERRMQDGLVLSDHAPVDCVIEVGP
jgi:endonuclease/exonuclease/phosphatase family metal-dependent hydrolase